MAPQKEEVKFKKFPLVARIYRRHSFVLRSTSKEEISKNVYSASSRMGLLGMVMRALNPAPGMGAEAGGPP